MNAHGSAASEPKLPQRSAPRAELTMLTVCTRKHYDDLQCHIRMMDRLNSGTDWRLVIVDNADGGISQLKVDHPRVEIRRGLPLDMSKAADVRFSYHHGSALNANLDDIGGRFLLVLDPDLFVVYPNWMRETIEHVLQRELCFFGVPWHPRWYMKYRYFPAVHFLLVDLQRVPLARLDFRPQLEERPSWSRRYRAAAVESAPGTSIRTNYTFSGFLRQAGWRMLNAVYRAGYFVFSRQLIGSSRDTGWKIWADFGSCPAEFVLPVVDLDSEFTAPQFLMTKLGRTLEAMFPVQFRFLPKRGTYFTPAEAAACGLPNLRSLGVEAFVWREKAFAFHRRGHMREQLNLPEADRSETLAWSAMLDRYDAPTQCPAGPVGPRSTRNRCAKV